MTDRWGIAARTAGALCVVAAATGVGVQHPPIGSTLITLIVLLYLTRRLDGWRRLFAITITLLVAATSTQPQLAAGSFYLRYAALGLLVVLTFAASPSRPQSRSGLPAQVLIGALWAAAALATLSSMWSVSPTHTLQQAAAMLLFVALIHGLVLRRWVDRSRIAGDLGVAYVVLTVSIIVSLAAAFGGVDSAWAFDGRLQGIYANPNLTGLLCAVTLPLGWAVYRQTRRRPVLLGFVPVAVALVLTESRTALLATVVGAVWAIARHGAGSVARLAGASAAVVGVSYLAGATALVVQAEWVGSLTQRFTDPAGGDYSSGRTGAWHAAVQLWGDQPVVGYGYSAGPRLFELTRGADLFGSAVNYVHNSYLQWLLELGLVGAVPLGAALTVCMWVVLRAPLAGVGGGLVWLVAVGLLVQVTESAMFGLGQPYPYVFWLAVAAAATRPLSGRHRAAGGAAGLHGAEVGRVPAGAS
ncbi:O-antigen ligase family protein [Micromonospora sp. LOL_024]|uniref:O-antigen ligase family protein n=1 Tax=Micromonospora sp. LOL_024 TaxID=3345412 RepID=UPI003A8673CB